MTYTIGEVEKITGILKLNSINKTQETSFRFLGFYLWLTMR